MDALLESDFAVAGKDRLYRCLDRIVEHKQELFVWLKQKWAELFHADFEVLLYDLTSTYFEGDMDECEMAKRGYSRDSRPDCAQVVIALIVTPDGFPLASSMRPLQAHPALETGPPSGSSCIRQDSKLRRLSHRVNLRF